MKKLAKIGLTAVGAYYGAFLVYSYIGLALKSMAELRQEQNGKISFAEYVNRINEDIKEGYRYNASDNRPAWL